MPTELWRPYDDRSVNHTSVINNHALVNMHRSIGTPQRTVPNVAGAATPTPKIFVCGGGGAAAQIFYKTDTYVPRYAESMLCVEEILIDIGGGVWYTLGQNGPACG